MSRKHGIVSLFWSVKNDGKYYTHPEPKRLMSDYNKGLAMEKDLLKPCTENAYAKASKPFKKALKKAGKTNRWNKKNRYKSGSVTKVFKRAIRGQKLSLYRVGLVSAVWGIIKNNIGIPTSKIRTGNILVKAKGERHCRIYTITARAQYAGGGRYAKATASLDAERDGFIVSRCK